MSASVAIGMGSNLGDRLGNLRAGMARVGTFVQDLVVSSVYETEPVGHADQPRFLNACCVGRTVLTPRQLLSQLQDAERSVGRQPGGLRFGPRVLDLDVLVYADLVAESDGLTLPHPRLRERAFVLVPLAEIAPGWVVPASGGWEAATVAELASAVEPGGITETEFAL